MANGKPAGEYSLKSITSTLTPGPGGAVLNSVNWEGTATGFGTLFGTSVFVGGLQGGSFSWTSQAFLDNGEGVTAVGHGTYGSAGKHAWNTKTLVEISDGRRLHSEGRIDLAKRTWTGTIYEA
jgi:hypothetical protein